MNFNPLDKNNALAYIVLFLSFGNLITNYNGDSLLSLIVSVVGIVGTILYFKGHNAFRTLLWLWVAAQAIVIFTEHADPISGYQIVRPVFDLRQYKAFSVTAGFHILGKHSTASIDFNFFVLGYAFLLRQLKTTSLIGKKLKILNIETNVALTADKHFLIQLNSRIKIDNNDQWLLGTPLSEVILNGQTIICVAVLADAGLLSSNFLVPLPNYNINSEGNSAVDFQVLEGVVIDARYKSIFGS